MTFPPLYISKGNPEGWQDGLNKTQQSVGMLFDEGSSPLKWQEYTASPHVIMSRKVTFEEWLALVEQSIKDDATRRDT